MKRNFPWFYAVIAMLISVMIAADSVGVVDDQAGISEPEQHALTRDSEQAAVKEEAPAEVLPESSDKMKLRRLLEQFGLEDEADVLANNGIKKYRDLSFIDDGVIKDLTLSPVSKAKLMKLVKALGARAPEETSEPKVYERTRKAAAGPLTELAETDSDGSGDVTFAELLVFMSDGAPATELNRKQVQEIFDKMDDNKDGLITREEELTTGASVSQEHCYISFTHCARHPELSSDFDSGFAADNLGVHLEQDRCLARAVDWHSYCKNARDSPVTATYTPTGDSLLYPPQTDRMVVEYANCPGKVCSVLKSWPPPRPCPNTSLGGGGKEWEGKGKGEGEGKGKGKGKEEGKGEEREWGQDGGEVERERRQKIALVVTGQYMRFSWQSLERGVIRPNVAAGHRVDVYIYLSRDDAGGTHNSHLRSPCHSLTPLSPLRDAREHVAGVRGGSEEWWRRAVCGRVSEETEALEEALRDRITRNVSSQRSGLVWWEVGNHWAVHDEIGKWRFAQWTGKDKGARIQMYVGWLRAWRAVEQEEVRTKLHYDTVFLQRADAYWLRPAPPVHLFAPTVISHKTCEPQSYMGVYDKVFVVPRIYASEWLQVVAYLYIDLQLTASFYNSEMFLWRLALGKGIALCGVGARELDVLPISLTTLSPYSGEEEVSVGCFEERNYAQCVCLSPEACALAFPHLCIDKCFGGCAQTN